MHHTSLTKKHKIYPGLKNRRLLYKSTALLFVAIFMGIGSFLILRSSAATTMCSSVTQYGVTYSFDKTYPCGTFANGDFWVAPNTGDAGVTLNSISPNYSSGHNGWQVNPVATGPQSFETDAGNFNTPPALPYLAHNNESVIKAISVNPTGGCPNNVGCLQTAVVLTVLGSPPPDGTGVGYLRPPYVGTSKPLYSVSQMQTQLLPSLAPPSGYSPSSISSVNSEVNRLQLDHQGGYLGRVLHPRDNMGDYGSTIAVTINDAVTRLMLNDSLSAKQPLLINTVQGGLDRYAAAISGQRWGGGGGYVPGKRLSMSFAALMLNDQSMKDNLRNMVFESDDSGVQVGKNGKVLYGGFEYNSPTSLNEDDYWTYTSTVSTTYMEYMDPYGYIDGGANPTTPDSYQFCCLAMPWKGEVLAMVLMPGLQSFWPNPSNLITYIDRWVSQGTSFQPDLCAPTGSKANYNITWGPDPRKPGDCIRGSGRFPSYDAQSPDGGYYRSDIVDKIWSAYRGTTTPPPTTTTPPTNSALPTISGTTRVSSSLTATQGTWADSPTSYAYQWQRCDSSGANCVNITTGGTSSSFALACADYKKTLKVQVRATNSSGNATASSSVTSVVAKPSTPTKGDFNDDCFVDATDVSLFIAKWRLSGSTYPSFDITGPSGTSDGTIDAWDLNVLVSGYGYK